MPIVHPHLNVEAAKEVNLVGLCQLEGIELSKSGGNRVGLCPFHSEKTPSFTVYPNNTYFCFGCNLSGDSIDFFIKIRQISFVEAVKALSTDSGSLIPVLTQKRTLTPLRPTKRVYVERGLVEMWHQALDKRPEKKEYLYSRLFTDRTIENERWGYCDSYYSFPVWDGIPDESDILAIRFRAGEGQEPRYCGLKGFNESALYNKHAIIGKLTALIFFGELDAQLATQDGFNACSPTNGKSVWLPEWTDYFEGVERVIIIPDKDDPKKLIPKRKVTLSTLKFKPKNENGVITEYESALEVSQFFGRRAEIKMWGDNFPEKDYNANRMAGMSSKQFEEWIGIERLFADEQK